MSDSGASEPMRDLEELVKEARKTALEVAQRAHGQFVVAFFDLTGSTAEKYVSGNAPAVRDALTFTSLAATISERCGGRVVKTLGDGALAVFEDAMDGCRAALNLRHATHEWLHLEMTAGLTAGRPLLVSLDGVRDVLGDVVDRAARIQGLAVPGQVLIDATLRGLIRADVVGEPNWVIDADPRRTYAKGVGPIEVYELSFARQWQPKKELATPFNVLADGRPTIDEKSALLRNAKKEIIEIGIGLTSFAQYFEGQKPQEFRDPIRELVRGGVNFKCFALDPGYGPGTAWLSEQDNEDYATEAQLARQRLEREGKFVRDNNFLGRFTYHTYRRVPEFWCLGVDVDDRLDGRMFFQSYLMGVTRSASPVIQVSRTSHSDLYAKFLTSVHAVREASDELSR